ncbi:RNA polymerase subunit 22 [Flamingopox virus FGPVKD09]|uniref:DNA-directed RNA polymerase subunit n=1 Tax=Flamingopox virus FGPVKD09 TaxID=2059380 RepID=A0A2H4X2E0_9POXV|nr:RNA polymerase subunit 22 [Flamingopox virus FGPVKD09]AUD40239.1 RNA polymerase subunit 22 [Flamingopox virus FGPVKD09]WCB87009.1 CPPV198 RNA polymerase subunit 22 [Cooks petrelpox virus]
MMNQYNVTYLSKILCLKAEILYKPFSIINRSIVKQYNIDVKYDDIISIVKIRHKTENNILVFQIFNESNVKYSPIEYDYGDPIIITSSLQHGHNKIPINMLYIDVVESDMFPTFSRLDSETIKIITSILQSDNKKEQSIKLPKVSENELSVKILYHKDYPLKYVRYYKNNMVTGTEVIDRSVAITS